MYTWRGIPQARKPAPGGRGGKNMYWHTLRCLFILDWLEQLSVHLGRRAWNLLFLVEREREKTKREQTHLWSWHQPSHAPCAQWALLGWPQSAPFMAWLSLWLGWSCDWDVAVTGIDRALWIFSMAISTNLICRYSIYCIQYVTLGNTFLKSGSQDVVSLKFNNWFYASAQWTWVISTEVWSVKVVQTLHGKEDLTMWAKSRPFNQCPNNSNTVTLLCN